jgi:hypothetical protein
VCHFPQTAIVKAPIIPATDKRQPTDEIMHNSVRKLLFIPVIAALASGCASTRQANLPVEQESGKVSCGSFFVYDMCMTDRGGDHRVDYVYFEDDSTIFMYQAGEALPEDMPVHRCAVAMSEDIVSYGSQLMYDEDMPLLEEMNIKRKLLLSYMYAKNEVDNCYGSDSAKGGVAEESDEDFVSDDYDWGED